MRLPRMLEVRQKLDETCIDDIEVAVRNELATDKIKALIRPGQSVAIAVGSRGIDHLDKIVRATVAYLKAAGALPFIVPAMGSHGGATAEGQRAVLRDYGVTEEAMGVPIRSSMEVTLLGHTAKGIPVHFDKSALAADMVALINRVKPHTNFRGPIESGLCKMMAIGLGNHIGCSRLHEEPWRNLCDVIVSVAEVVLAKANIGFGLAIVENAFHKPALIEALVKDEILTEEPKLQSKSKAMMPAIPVPEFDVLVVEQFGKDISGDGMDPNIIGHKGPSKSDGFGGPSVKRIVILDLSEGTHGNAGGIGRADFTTKAVFNKLDFTSTYANMIAVSTPEGGRIPIVMENEREAIIAAVKCCRGIPEIGPRIVRIKDTLHLDTIWVSENLLPIIEPNPALTIVGELTNASD